MTKLPNEEGENPIKKKFQTLKKDHQITHMKIICTAVEETHTIYGQAIKHNISQNQD